MELEGRKVLILLSGTGGREFVGVRQAAPQDEASRWFVGGQVAGEIPGVGLLVAIVYFETERGPAHPPTEDPVLLRWEWIVTLSVFPHGQQEPQYGIGFR
jgi:hypothetical protein